MHINSLFCAEQSKLPKSFSQIKPSPLVPQLEAKAVMDLGGIAFPLGTYLIPMIPIFFTSKYPNFPNFFGFSNMA